MSWPSSKKHKRINKWKSINNFIVLYSLWNTYINSLDQQVAVEYFVFCMGCINPQLPPMAVSATLIGNWQTDFVIDHNARGKWWLYYSWGNRFMKGHNFLKTVKETNGAQTSAAEQWWKSPVPLCVCVNSTTAHGFVCVWSRMLLGVLTADERRRTDTGWVVHQSLAFKGCTLSQYTSAYDSCGGEVSQTVTVSQSSQLDSADNPPSPNSKANHCLIRLGFRCLVSKGQWALPCVCI